MKVFHRREEVLSFRERASVAIGNFDGFHRGHKQLVHDTVSFGRSQGFRPTILTFFPHPREVLQKNIRLERLMTTDEKLTAFELAGIETVFVLPFDQSVADCSAEEFFAKYLVETLGAQSVHVGDNFQFGKGRKGNVKALEQLCKSHGIGLRVVPPVMVAGSVVSSTRIRTLLQEGNVEEAKSLLGEPYGITGSIVHGDSRGKALGYPTANILPPEEKLIPKPGVYATRLLWQKQLFPSVSNVGFRPTFGAPHGNRPLVEVHLFNFSAQIYDEKVTVEFVSRLRDEKKFASIDDLKIQIKNDLETAKKRLMV